MNIEQQIKEKELELAKLKACKEAMNVIQEAFKETSEIRKAIKSLNSLNELLEDVRELHKEKEATIDDLMQSEYLKGYSTNGHLSFDCINVYSFTFEDNILEDQETLNKFISFCKKNSYNFTITSEC